MKLKTPMRIYFAPMEGITGYIFRQTYEKHFGGVTAYYSPFVTMRDGGFMKKKEKRDVLPENNHGYRLIPQILTNKAEDFCQASKHMAEMGYEEVNLNLGCPSGTVTAKFRGAGFLRMPEELDRFLDNIFKNCKLKISIKTRVGYSNADEFYLLLEIFNKYPVKELIIHPRTRADMYTGKINEECFEYAFKNSKNPICYNGDICTPDDIISLSDKYPKLSSVMIGRGFLKHPGFVKISKEGVDFQYTDPGQEKNLFDFINELEDSYKKYMSGEKPVLFKMKEMWAFLQESFPEGNDIFKKIKRAKKLHDYDHIIKQAMHSAKIHTKNTV